MFSGVFRLQNACQPNCLFIRFAPSPPFPVFNFKESGCSCREPPSGVYSRHVGQRGQFHQIRSFNQRHGHDKDSCFHRSHLGLVDRDCHHDQGSGVLRFDLRHHRIWTSPRSPNLECLQCQSATRTATIHRRDAQPRSARCLPKVPIGVWQDHLCARFTKTAANRERPGLPLECGRLARHRP